MALRERLDTVTGGERNMEPENVTSDLEPTRITIDEVKGRLVQGEPLLFIDARNPKAWESTDMKLPGARRLPVDEVGQQLSELSPERTIVTYCT
jgi:rhodanese-related sulfurtransferase